MPDRGMMMRTRTTIKMNDGWVLDTYWKEGAGRGRLSIVEFQRIKRAVAKS